MSLAGARVNPQGAGGVFPGGHVSFLGCRADFAQLFLGRAQRRDAVMVGDLLFPQDSLSLPLWRRALLSQGDLGRAKCSAFVHDFRWFPLVVSAFSRRLHADASPWYVYCVIAHLCGAEAQHTLVMWRRNKTQNDVFFRPTVTRGCRDSCAPPA